MKTLFNKLKEANELYRAGKETEYTDAEYDKLLASIKTDENELELTSDITKGDENAKHTKPMLSLNKINSVKECEDFCDKIIKTIGEPNVNFVVEYKYDGIAMKLSYDNRGVMTAITRGDGATGVLRTEHVRHINGLPRQGSYRGQDIRGEVVMSWASFKTYTERALAKGDKAPKNPRNVCAGIMSRDTVTIEDLKLLDFKYYGNDATTMNYLDGVIQYERLSKTDVILKTIQGSVGIPEYIEEMEKSRNGFRYPVDGVVIKLNLAVHNEKFSSSSRTYGGTIAYKFTNASAVTQFKRYDFSIGAFGKLTPTAVYDEVAIRGSYYNRATMHNIRALNNIALAEGDDILVEIANDIIPQITKVIKHNGIKPVSYDDNCKCPSCGTKLEFSKSGSDLFCRNTECPEMLDRQLEKAVSKKGLNIKGIGPEMVTLLRTKYGVKTFWDLFDLKDTEIKITSKNLKTVIERIEYVRTHMEGHRLLYAMCIPNIGSSKSIAIEGTIKEWEIDNNKSSNSIKRYTELLKSAYDEAMLTGFLGEVAYESYVKYMTANRTLIESNLKTYKFDYIKEESIVKGTQLEGLTVCVTGKDFDNTGLKRAGIEKMIKSYGGKTCSSVKVGCILVHGRTLTTETKLNKAKDKGIKCFSYNKFVSSYNLK